MAIVEMQKLGVYALKSRRKETLELLQKLGAMEIAFDPGTEERFERMDTAGQRVRFERIADIFDQALALIKEYAPPEKSPLLNLEREMISGSEMDEVIRDRSRYYSDAKKIVALEKEITDAQAAIVRKSNKIESLRPWEALDIPLNSEGTKKTTFFIGTFPEMLTEEALLNICQGDSEEALPVSCEVVHAENQQTEVFIAALKRVEKEVEANIKARGFIRLPFITHRTPTGGIEKREKEILKEEEKIRSVKEEIAGYREECEKFRVASDYYRTRAEKYRVLGTIPQSEHVFFIEGWVEKDKAGRIEKLLTEKCDAAVEMLETREGEEEPTVLRNNAFSESVEGVLESYGLPQHKKADPTFIMSIFYVFFFGMMLSDAGYGILITIATFIVLKKYPRMADGTKKMMKLFFWCGISTAFWGFMYGGFFGDAIDVIATNFFGYTGETPILKPLWFAPLENPMRLLVWCMLFGLIHLFAGLAVKGYEYLKDHDVVGFLSDVVAWYLFIAGLVLMLLPTSLFESVSGISFGFPAWLKLASKIMTVLGLVVIVLMSGRANKNWGLRIALGAYDIYGVTGWLSDVLSYSRLLALGLATGVIANVINMMASMAGSGVVKVIIFVVVFIFGHLLNLAINMLGAYVHTNRLQFVEFFGKFYDGGGVPFKPFKTNYKYVEVKEEM